MGWVAWYQAMFKPVASTVPPVVPSQMGFWTAALALHPLLRLVSLRLMAVKVFLLAAAWGSPGKVPRRCATLNSTKNNMDIADSAQCHGFKFQTCSTSNTIMTIFWMGSNHQPSYQGILHR
jgi:hypothetical protein